MSEDDEGKKKERPITAEKPDPSMSMVLEKSDRKRRSPEE